MRFHIFLAIIEILLIFMISWDVLKSQNASKLMPGTILVLVPFYLFFATWSPVTQKEYDSFVERKAYIETYEPTSEIDAATIGAEVYELNTWLKENQEKIIFQEGMYVGLPDGFMEETPINP